MIASRHFAARLRGHSMPGIIRIFPQIPAGAALAVGPAASYINRFALKDSYHALA